MLSFYKQQSYFSQIVSKKAKITILFWVLVFSFMCLVSVYPTNRTKDTFSKTLWTGTKQFGTVQNRFGPYRRTRHKSHS